MKATDAAQAKKTVADATQRTGAQQDFQTIATLGYATDSNFFDVSTSAILKRGLERLAGRRPFVDEVPMAFCSDAVGILGVALGARFLADEPVSAKIITWLSSFRKIIYHLDGTDNWQRCFFQAADRVLEGRIGLPHSRLDQCGDAYLALIAKGVFVAATGRSTEQEDEEALKLILQEGTHELPYDRAAVRLVEIVFRHVAGASAVCPTSKIRRNCVLSQFAVSGLLWPLSAPTANTMNWPLASRTSDKMTIETVAIWLR
jgi:hypothetical protein